MLEKEIPDYNLFLVCKKLNKKAFREQLKEGYSLRNCREDEFETWKKFPFDTEKEAKEYDTFMQDFFEKNYQKKWELFLKQCKFICDKNDKPVATGFVWKYRDKYMSVHWLKTLKEEEGKGLGRYLLTQILKSVEAKDYPIYLHTQPGSFKAIKLYSDFGFELIKEPKVIDKRRNEFKEALPILKEFMKAEDYEKLKFCNIDNKFKKVN